MWAIYRCERVLNVNSAEQVEALVGGCVVCLTQENGSSPVMYV